MKGRADCWLKQEVRAKGRKSPEEEKQLPHYIPPYNATVSINYIYIYIYIILTYYALDSTLVLLRWNDTTPPRSNKNMDILHVLCIEILATTTS